MKSLLLLVFALFVNSVGAQVQSSCTAPALLSKIYQRDVANMAITRMYSTNSPDTAFIKIPATQSDPVIGGLAAIFNATSIPERDSVFNLYCVHDLASAKQSYNSTLVGVDSNYSWTTSWKNLNPLTGIPGIDSLVTRYGLKVSQFYNWTIGNYALIETDSIINGYALSNKLSKIAGITSCEPNMFVGSAGRIEYSASGNTRYYNFYFEFNDCFDGCDNYHVWRFKVNADCSVEYLGYSDYGTFGIQTLPTPLNCNSFTSVKDLVKQNWFRTFPNPAKNSLTINWTKNTGRPVDLMIYDVQGKEIRKVADITNKTEFTIDISNYPAGQYIINLLDQNNIIATGKITKE